jgi:choline dehydrogenase
MTHAAELQADVLIIGGGSAGCVMARRLSEDPARRVVLLESGPGEPAAGWLRAVRNGNQPAVVSGLNWKFRTHIKGEGSDRAAGSIFNYEAGRLLGGSSAVNATQALRGHPSDFESWASECGPGWSWEGVLPYFRKLEDDPLGPSDIHGRGGPMPIRREAPSELTPMHAALVEACLAKGHPQTADHNDHRTSGVGVIPRNVVDGVRMSAAATYLAPARDRDNLQVIADTHVHRLLWGGGGTCTGVLAETDGRLRELRAAAVVLCAGVIGTPLLLMRSGVGKPQALRAAGVPVELPLSGVGRNLQEHPVVGIWGVPCEGMGLLGDPLRQTLLRYASGASGAVDDIHLCLMTGFDAKEMFPHLAGTSSAPTLSGLTVCFNRSVSRGSVRLASADPHAAPLVSNNCLGDPQDLAPLVDGVRRAWDLLQVDCLRGKFERLLAWSSSLVGSHRALEQAVSTFVRPAAHACGTARMGRSPDEGAVADGRGRLFGAGNVWVGDASAFPHIPSAPPHLTCLMVAEKIADEIRKEH